MKKTSSEDQVLIGKVGSPNGLKGEVRITLYQHDSNNLKEGKVLLLKHEQKTPGKAARAEGITQLSAKVERVRYQKDRPVVKLEGIDDRNAAEEIRGMQVFLEADDLEPLPEGEHYVRDLIGCRVVDIDSDPVIVIGVLRDVIQNTAQSILEVETPEGRTVLIPAVDEFLVDIDEDQRLIEVKLIPGFIE